MFCFAFWQDVIQTADLSSGPVLSIEVSSHPTVNSRIAEAKHGIHVHTETMENVLRTARI
jgi:hypothetical protein